MSLVIQNIGPASVRWHSAGEAARSLRCPVCTTTGPKPPMLDIPSMADGSQLTLFACPDCGSAFYDPPGIRDFSEIQGNADDFWKSYVEVGAGIWEMYWPAAAASAKPDASLLDVGCGFGFTVDAWRRMRGEAVGVELAEYGRAGAVQLGVPIHAEYLQDIASLRGRRFDVVYASEVIEHVPDPRQFARLLAEYVSADGTLCLTTPNAAFISPQHAGPTLVAALCPGFHGFLIAPDEMKRILLECGFTHVEVRAYGERLISWAARRPLAIEEGASALRAQYLGYLDRILDQRTQNDPVTAGIAYRRFRDAMLSQDFAAARTSLARLEACLDARYAAGWRDPERAAGEVRSLELSAQYDTRYPWFLPNFYYLRGLYAKLQEKDEPAARRHFRAARLTTMHIAMAWGISYTLEALSFVPEAWQQEAVSAAIAGDASVCEDWIARLPAAGYRIAPELSDEKLTARQIEQAFLESLSILSSLNRPDSLAKALNHCLEYLDGAYAGWAGAEFDAGAPQPCAQLLHEQRMYFHFKLAQACSQLGIRREIARPQLERVLKLRAMQAQPNPMANWISDQAQKMLAAMAPRPAAPAAAKTSFTYSFNLTPKK